ncbi:MAG: SRPBCC family protein [Sphingobacteriaceae bacterium]
MKILKICLTILILVLVVFFFGGFFLPRTYHLEASITVKKSDTLVFSNVADLNAFAQWNPWSTRDPGAQNKAINLPGIIGSTFHWNGKAIGEGKLEITYVIINKHLDEKLTFTKPWKREAETSFHFEPAAGGTRVLWSLSGENKSTLDRWMTALFRASIKRDCDNGLAQLQKYCEEN